MKRLLLFIGLVIITGNFAFGIPAYPKMINFTQPDGNELQIFLHGDEFIKWAETADGYTLLFNSKGFYEYAIINSDGDLKPSGVVANNMGERSARERILLSPLKKNLFYSKKQLHYLKQVKAIHQKEIKNAKAFPTTGNSKLICILIGFTDLAFTKTQADFNNLFNQVGYSADGATGSVKNFYLENSWNQFNLTVDIAGPYTASNNMSYYGANDADGNDLRPRELVTEAVNLADPDVNFADYDNDEDGSVDGIYIIYAGYGEEAGASADAIWAHAWTFGSVAVDGVSASRYSCSSELRSSSGTGITRIGVICHEFGHVLGAPDYYDTDYDTGGQYSGTGSWDLMAGGAWNNGGSTPAHHNGFTKWHYYNWITANELNIGQSVTMNNIENNQTLYYFTTSTTNEYFLLENRQQTGFDANLPGHGLIIYHVDQDNVAIHDGSNDINVTHPQYMYPVCANAGQDPSGTAASYGTINSGGLPFPGTSGITQFTDATLPSSKDWANNNSNKPITNIQENSGVITFDFMGGNQGNPQDFTASPISSSQIVLSWNLNTNSDPVLVAWSADGTFGAPTDGTIYSSGDAIAGGGTVLQYNTGTGYNHTSLTHATTYSYKLWSYDGAQYSPGVVADATTDCDAFSSLPFAEDFSEGALPNCWQNIDNQSSGQIWEFNNPAEINFNATTADNGFAVLDSDNYGSGNSQNADLISPLFDFSAYTDINLSFEHYYKDYENETATLSYSTDNGSTWNTINSWSGEDTENIAVFNQTITEAAGQPNVMFKWNYTGGWGYYWAIDDVSITGTAADTPVITISTNSFSFGNTEAGTTSSEQSYTVSGSNLTENITVTAPADFEISETSGSGFTSSITLAQSGGTVNSTTIYARFAPTAEQSYAGDVTHVSSGATSANVAVSGTGTGPTCSVLFSVTDGTNPIQGATISIDGQSLTTDASGEATIDLTDGTYSYAVNASGYDPISNGEVIVSGAALTENVTMTETVYTLTFNVTNGTDPIAGADISIDGQSLTTDANGEATIGLPDGTYSYSVNASGYDPISNGEVIVSGAVLTENVTMTETVYTLTFNVTNGTYPIAGADISIDGQSLTTNENGEAIIELPDGTYSYAVNARGYDPISNGEVIVSGAVLTENVTMTETVYTLTFNVTNGTDPIAGADISIDGQSLTTDASGEATIDLTDGTYSYAVNASGYDPISNGEVIVSGAALTENVTMTETVYTLTFNVTNGTDPIAGADISIDGQSLTTNASGEATIDLRDGTYSYAVNASGYDPISNGEVIVSGAALTENVTMTETVYTLTFNVTNGTDPIAGADISIDGQSLTTNASGEATIDLRDGTYSYAVNAGGYDPITDGELTVSGAVLTENVTMDETVGITDIDNEISIFPNPSTEKVYIFSPKQVNLQVLDLTGKILENKIFSGKTEISLKTSGLYFLKFTDENGSRIEKIIIQ